MALLLLVPLLAGCHQIFPFSVTRPAGDAGADADATGRVDLVQQEAAIGDAAAQDLLGDASTGPLCDPTDDKLVACFAFEGNTQDGSKYGVNPTLVVDVGYAAGVANKAAALASTSRLSIGDHANHSGGTTISLELWINPTQPVTGSRWGLLDKQNAYGLFLLPDGSVACYMAETVKSPAGAVPIGAGKWTHVACVADDTQRRLYVGGKQVDEVSSSGGIASSSYSLELGGDSPSGGERFIGNIDSLRIWRLARTAQQICQEAGTCP